MFVTMHIQLEITCDGDENMGVYWYNFKCSEVEQFGYEWRRISSIRSINGWDYFYLLFFFSTFD